MLNILLPATRQPDIPLDTSDFIDDLETNLGLSAVTDIVAGRVVSLVRSGAVLADGMRTNYRPALGFIIEDAIGRDYYHHPTIASTRVAYCPLDAGVTVETDQFIASPYWQRGAPVYVGTGEQAGRLVIAPENATRTTITFANVVYTCRIAGDWPQSLDMALVGVPMTEYNERFDAMGNGSTIVLTPRQFTIYYEAASGLADEDLAASDGIDTFFETPDISGVTNVQVDALADQTPAYSGGELDDDDFNAIGYALGPPRGGLLRVHCLGTGA